MKTFLPALMALSLLDYHVPICKDQQIIGLMPSQLSFNFSDSSLKKIFYNHSLTLSWWLFARIGVRQIKFTKNKDPTVQQKRTTQREFNNETTKAMALFKYNRTNKEKATRLIRYLSPGE